MTYSFMVIPTRQLGLQVPTTFTNRGHDRTEMNVIGSTGLRSGLTAQIVGSANAF